METAALTHPLRRCSGSALKWAAIVTMFLDHVGATLVWRQMMAQPTLSWASGYTLLRTVGRVAFPIFCFLLVEGFLHTQSRKNYALRLGAFALLSELPFDLALNGPRLPDWSGQNVFFTLLLGFLAMWACDGIARRWPGGGGRLLQIIVTGALCVAAELLATDYGAFGVALIAALYWGRCWPGLGQPWHSTLLGSVAVLGYCGLQDNWIEVYAILGLLLTLTYNGARGRQNKYFFYAFYPVHLLVLGLLAKALF